MRKELQKEIILKEQLELVKQLEGMAEERGGTLTRDELAAFFKQRMGCIEKEEGKQELRVRRTKKPGEIARGEGIYLFERREEEKEEYAQFEAELENGRIYCCSVRRQEDDAFLGYVTIHDRNKELWEFGIELREEYQSRGYGKKALRLFLPAMAKRSGKKEFRACVEADNLKSQRLMESLGGKLVGIVPYPGFDLEEEELLAIEEKYTDRISEPMRVLAKRLQIEPKKLLTHILEYRFVLK